MFQNARTFNFKKQSNHEVLILKMYLALDQKKKIPTEKFMSCIVN